MSYVGITVLCLISYFISLLSTSLSPPYLLLYLLLIPDHLPVPAPLVVGRRYAVLSLGSASHTILARQG